MPDEIRVNEDRCIIEIDSCGAVSNKDIARSISKVQQILADKGISKILVDTTKQDTMPGTMDIFELFSTFPREFTLALLLDKRQRTEADLSFAENVGVNRGILMQIFYDKERALQWLDNG